MTTCIIFGWASFIGGHLARRLLATGQANHMHLADVVVDKSQRTERYTSATFLANMGIPVRVDAMHAIMHNKFIVVDGQHVQAGSYNYSKAAEERNAENAVVNWNSPRLAAIYTDNWRLHWDHSEPYQARY